MAVSHKRNNRWVIFSFRLPKALKARLATYADQLETPEGEIIRDSINKTLDEREISNKFNSDILETDNGKV